MWSDKELDEAFRRLSPPKPEAESFPLDAWLRLEQQLDKQTMEREFRRRLWRFFVAEMLVVAVGALVWLAWPVRQPAIAAAGKVPASAAAREAGARGPMAETTVAAQSQQQKVAARLSNAITGGAANKAAITSVASASTSTSNESMRATETDAGLVQPSLGNGVQSAGGGAAGPAGLAGTTGGVANDSAVSASRGRSYSVVAGLAMAQRQRSEATLQPAGREHSAARRKTLVYATTSASAPRTTASPANRLSAKSPSKLIATKLFTALVANGSSSRQPALATSLFKPAASQPAGITSAQSVTPTPTTRDALSVVPAATASSSIDAAATAVATDFTGLAPLSIVVHTDSATALPAPLAPLPLTTTPLPEPLQQPRLYLGLLAAPDVSTVKMADYQAPTPNLGVLLEYRLTSRLRVNTGLLRSTKQYRARRRDYDWSYYPRGANGTFEWVDGHCTILDVPVNLRYDVLARPRYQVFGSAGLSSLFMQHETYAYDYEYYGQLYRWQSSFTNENQHWFSVLNLSAGYERNLGRHWRLQAEPYVKLPLGGVGAGKVRLMSGGVFFGVKYGL